MKDLIVGPLDNGRDFISTSTPRRWFRWFRRINLPRRVGICLFKSRVEGIIVVVPRDRVLIIGLGLGSGLRTGLGLRLGLGLGLRLGLFPRIEPHNRIDPLSLLFLLFLLFLLLTRC